MCFLFYIPQNEKEKLIFVTHHLLLDPDIWNLPLVVQRCYRLCVVPPAVVLCTKHAAVVLDCKSRCIYLCSTSTNTITYTRSLQTLSYTHHTTSNTNNG